MPVSAPIEFYPVNAPYGAFSEFRRDPLMDSVKTKHILWAEGENETEGYFDLVAGPNGPQAENVRLASS